MPTFLQAVAVTAATLFAAVVMAAIGGDVSEYYGTSTWQCAVQNGWEFVIIRSYCSYGGVDPNVKSTMAAAVAGGITYHDVYHFPCMGQDAASQMQADIANIGLGNFGQLWLDIETNPSPGCGWSSDYATNCQFLADLISAGQAAGASVGIYASEYEWSITVGSGCTAGADAGLPLWYANWDGAQNFNDFSPFGGWNTPAMKQYDDSVGGTCGLNADADWW